MALQQLRPEDAASLCASDAPPLLLDVREGWEVAVAAIHAGTAPECHIPMGRIPERLAELDTEQPVVCICHHGMRSEQVAHFLERQGFAAVYNLAGGIDAWAEQVDTSVPRY